jgi:hypothetical protein
MYQRATEVWWALSQGLCSKVGCDMHKGYARMSTYVTSTRIPFDEPQKKSAIRFLSPRLFSPLYELGSSPIVNNSRHIHDGGFFGTS